MILKANLKILNAHEQFLRDPLGLVKSIVKTSLLNYPFQNVTPVGKFLPRERIAPQFQNILMGSEKVKGYGGLCCHLNNYVKLQLERLGYPVELVSGEFRRTGVPMTHFLVKFKIPGYAVNENIRGREIFGLKKEDRTYLIDVGSGVPLHEPICLEKLPYHGRAGGLNFRFEKVDEKTIRRVNENGDALMGEKPSSYLSPQDYTVDLQPRNMTEFQGPLCSLFKNPRSVFLHRGLYCFRYLDITDDDFQIVCIRGKELMFITKETRHTQLFSSYEDIKPNLLKYFPMIPPPDVELTVKHFSIPFEEALKMSSMKTLDSGAIRVNT